ncbi:MAG: MFS transporter [Lachnospiraceae bacterium]|nr:MFS transporter [Lachnospiraceae bacterium]
MKIKDKRKVDRLLLLFSFTYFVSYVTRINYGAVVSEMVTSLGLPKSTLSMALTGCFITYGAGQLITGFFGDRIQPKRLVTVGMLTSIVMNLLIPICFNPVQMTVVWCVNGFAQAFMWPPLVKLMASLFSPEDYNRGCVRVSWGSSLGTMFVYLMAPLLIALRNWQTVFVVCAALGLMGVVLWNLKCPNIELAPAQEPCKERSGGSVISVFSPMLICVMVAIVLQGILRDGVQTWMPSYIAETYHLSNEISILTGFVMPIFSIVCNQATGYLCRKKFQNPMQCAAVIWGVSAVSALALYLLSDYSAATSVFLSAVLTGCMHGVNLLLVCMLPPRLAGAGRVSVVSGMLNCCTYIGSAVSMYAIPLATENSGWEVTILLWVLAAVAGTLLCSVCIRAWRKKTL